MARPREEVASCIERAYARLKVSDAQKMLMFSSEKDVVAYASEVRGTISTSMSLMLCTVFRRVYYVAWGRSGISCVGTLAWCC